MVDVLRIKRRLAGGAAGPPSSLAAAELAYNEQDDKLYYGKGNSGGAATSIVAIAGSGAYEPKITAGTTAQYWRGDKTFQTLDKAAIGLGNVDNTSDANKPVSTAQAAADALRILKAGDTMTGNLIINKAVPNLTVDKTASGQASMVLGKHNGLLRWEIDLGDAAGETGGNAGSDFAIHRYADTANTYLASALNINRATGLITLGGDLARTGGIDIQGTNTNDSPPTGYIGEVIAAELLQGSATALVSGTAKTITSISVTPGDWDINGVIAFLGGATPMTVSLFAASISETTNAFELTPGRFVSNNQAAHSHFSTAWGFEAMGIPPLTKKLIAMTTIYLVARADFTTGSMTAFGRIQARRSR